MSTSKLQIEVGNLLDKTFPEYHIHENYRPEWLASSNLTLLELDFYIEELKLAFEIQGDQHSKFIPFFHKTQDGYQKQIKYDEEKKDLCRGAGINLIEIYSMMDAIIEVKSIAEPQGKDPTISYYTYKDIEKELYLCKIQKDALSAELSKLKTELNNIKSCTNIVRIQESIKDQTKVEYALGQWQRKATKRFGNKRPISEFQSDVISYDLHNFITTALEKCSTKADIVSVFVKAHAYITT